MYQSVMKNKFRTYNIKRIKVSRFINNWHEDAECTIFQCENFKKNIIEINKQYGLRPLGLGKVVWSKVYICRTCYHMIVIES